MAKLFRLSAYLVLITLVLSLGDWPFLDEILAEQVQIQREELSSLQSNPTLTSSVAKTSIVSHSSGSIYQSLMNLVDMPRHDFPKMVASHAIRYWPEVSRFESAIPDSLERPPILLLS